MAKSGTGVNIVAYKPYGDLLAQRNKRNVTRIGVA